MVAGIKTRDGAISVDETVQHDEQDATARLIGWSAPIARALRGARVGDLRKVTLPGGEKQWEVIAISYPAYD